jgi:hypothetical protein
MQPLSLSWTRRKFTKRVSALLWFKLRINLTDDFIHHLNTISFQRLHNGVDQLSVEWCNNTLAGNDTLIRRLKASYRLVERWLKKVELKPTVQNKLSGNTARDTNLTKRNVRLQVNSLTGGLSKLTVVAMAESPSGTPNQRPVEVRVC